MPEVRWKLVLPIVMVFLSTFLMLITHQQQLAHRGMGTGLNVPARTINFMINGPGFWFFPRMGLPDEVDRALANDGGRLFGVTVIWVLIGLGLDHRRENRDLSRQRPWLALALFGIAAIIFAAFAGLFGVWFYRSYEWELPWRYVLWQYATATFGFAIWSLVLFAYFARRSFAACKNLRRSPAD
jgi:hypothetical protein